MDSCFSCFCGFYTNTNTLFSSFISLNQIRVQRLNGVVFFQAPCLDKRRRLRHFHFSFVFLSLCFFLSVPVFLHISDSGHIQQPTKAYQLEAAGLRSFSCLNNPRLGNKQDRSILIELLDEILEGSNSPDPLELVQHQRQQPYSINISAFTSNNSTTNNNNNNDNNNSPLLSFHVSRVKSMMSMSYRNSIIPPTLTTTATTTKAAASDHVTPGFKNTNINNTVASIVDSICVTKHYMEGVLRMTKWEVYEALLEMTNRGEEYPKLKMTGLRAEMQRRLLKAFTHYALRACEKDEKMKEEIMKEYSSVMKTLVCE